MVHDWNGWKSYFSKGLRELLFEDYYLVGIMAGITMLQNGPLPRIFDEKVLDILFRKVQLYLVNVLLSYSEDLKYLD